MPKIIVVQKNKTLAGCEIIKAFQNTSDVVVLKEITGTEIKFTNGASEIGKEDKVLIARPLSHKERRIFHKLPKVFLKSCACPESNGMAILQRLAGLGAQIGEGLLEKVAKADAANNGQVGLSPVKNVVQLFAKEINTVSCNGRGEIPINFTQRSFGVKLRQTSGRLCPEAVNQGYMLLDEPQEPQVMALLSHAVSLKSDSFDKDDLLAHLVRGTKGKAPLFANVPDQGMVFACTSRNFIAALPRAESRLTELLESAARTLPEGEVTRHHSCAKLVVEAKGKANIDSIQAIKHLFLDHTPLAARTVKAASLRLFLPFKGQAPEGESKCWHTDEDQQSVVKAEDYFLGHLQRLFCTNSENISELRSSSQSETKPEISLAHPGYHEGSLNFPVKAAHFHTLGSEAFLLELEIIAPEGISLARWLDFVSFARRVKNLYEVKTSDENGDEKPVSWQFGNGTSAHMLEDICTYYKLDKSDYLGDDRAFAFQSTILEGNPPVQGTGAAETLEIVLERYSALDGWGDGRFYSESVSRKEFDAAAYPRFQDTGSTLMATAHSFSFMGFDERKAASFALKHIHHGHMPWIYRRMVVYAQLVRAQLNSYEQKLDELVGNTEGNKNDIRRLRNKFSTFVHCTWRETVSSQVQGQELFALITKQMGLKARIAKLSKDFEVLDMEETRAREAAAEERAQRADMRHVFYAFLIGLVTMILTIFQVLGDERSQYFPVSFGFLELTEENAASVAVLNYLILIVEIVIGAILLYGLASFLSHPKEIFAKGASWLKSKWANHKK